MRLQSSVVIRRKPDEVWSFLTDPLNIPRWDRGVAAVEVNQSSPRGAGLEFTTVGQPGSGPDRGRMTYRVTEAGPQKMDCRAALTSRTGNARSVRAAAWRQQVEDTPPGLRVTISVEFRLRFCYFWLAPLLFVFGNSAHKKDLRHLQDVLEKS